MLFKWNRFELDLSLRTHLMGILNVTPDSFSDGGAFLSLDDAIERAHQMVEDGDEVKEGQTLFKLSAMKMETEIKAPISGTVTRLLVEKGDSVEADDLLAVIYSDE